MDYRSPKSPEEFDAYFQLRWETLREPWGQPRGSERGDDEDESFHLMAIENERVFGVGRIHAIDDKLMQIRYMGVAEKARGRGVGRGLIAGLEAHALASGAHTIQLNARENAVPFYEANGYRIVEKSSLLWGEIQHFLMSRDLARR